MNKIIDNLRKELKQNIDEKYKEGCINFFKEKIECYGVRTDVVKKIANKYYLYIKDLSKKELFKICEELFKSNYNEEAFIAIAWLEKRNNIYEEKDMLVFEKIINRYLNNWAKIDVFCTGVVNPLIVKYPYLIEYTNTWTTSKNRWTRRASAVSLIVSKKKNKSFYDSKKKLNHIFNIAKKLMQDEEDLVQKGYGWMLKVASNYKQKEVFDFVMKNKQKMSRTALRYAIEKMPNSLRKEAMKK
jgi:3-methyladenine DNA glycosylase AlkD